MASISLHQSSFIRLATFFVALIAIAIFLFVKEMQMIGPGSDAASVTLRMIIIVLLVIAAGLFFISVQANKRINRILRTADTIMKTGDLSSRIPLPSNWGDLHTLSAFINDMLSQIEESVESTRHVSDSIAHDLRTPLTRLRNRIEALQHKPCGAADYADQMQSIINECDAILNTFNGMLRISRIETERRKDRFAPLNLADLMQDVAELYEPLAQEKHLSFTLNTVSAPINADRDLLFQCFANLLDNAIKYTGEGGHINVQMQPLAQQILITISDTGHGISDDQKEKVFKRFYRGDAMRCTPGNGLGLSLVAAVIKLHQGQITLTDNSPKGLKAQITLPLAS